MMGIVVGTNRLEYCKIKKRDVVRHFFTTRNQLYKFYPDGLIPMDIYHDGAYIETQSVTMFEENGTRPYHTKYAEQYDKDVILMNIDEHKLMSPRRSKLSAMSGVRTKPGRMSQSVRLRMPRIPRSCSRPSI